MFVRVEREQVSEREFKCVSVRKSVYVCVLQYVWACMLERYNRKKVCVL